MKTGTVRELREADVGGQIKGGRFHCVLEIPNDCVEGIREGNGYYQIELNLPIGGELDLGHLINQIENSELNKPEQEGLIEEIQALIDQAMVGAFLRRRIRVDR